MAITENFNIDPYYDDFDDTKGYHRILFRPGYAVQARELTQLQTILQGQIEKFGKHVFKQGSMVLGGQLTFENENVYYIKLDDNNVNGNSVDVTKFVGKFIKQTGSTNIRAYVVAAATSTSTDAKTLVVKYYSATKFSTAQNIEDEAGEYFATSKSTSATGSASIVSIDDGVFFVDGYFVKVNRQTLILEKYSASPSYRIGLEITDGIVTESGDTSLLDPAQDASNYQAPGATRYQIELTLSKRTLSSVDDSKFINLMRVNAGVIEQRIIYPNYSVLEDTLARRTYDESGDYTVRPFIINLRDDLIANNANDYNIVLGPGKAYVKGYEFETISPTILTSPRARDYNSRTNYTIALNYQNYVDVTHPKGTIDFSGYTTLNVHSVPLASINTTSSNTATSTRIGTIRIRALDYQYGANSTSIANSVWRAYVFDSDIGTRTGNCSSSGSNTTIVLDTNASSDDKAYVGVKVRVTNHMGTAQTQSRVITAYNGATKTATVGTDWQYFTPNTNTQFSLDYEFKDAESFEHSNNTAGVDVSGDSKYSILTDDYQGAYITEPNYNSLLFPFPNFAIKDGSIANAEYFGRRAYTGKTFDSSGVLSFSTDDGYISTLTGSVSQTDAIDNFYVVVTSPESSTYANNSIINMLSSNVSVGVVQGSNTSTVTITAPGANTARVSVYMKVKVPYPETLSLANIRKTKTKRTANTLFVTTTGADAIATGISLFNAEVDQPGLQLNIDKANIANLTSASSTQSLYVADVISLRGVYDFGANEISYTNLASATDITLNYTLNDGQNDNAYEHASIKLKSGKTGPKGNVVIFADYYDHTGTGYITVDSYIAGNTAYKDIPTYTSPNSGKLYYLRDLIDFRLRRKNGSEGVTGGYNDIVLGTSGTSLELDYSYYLPRIDKVVVTKNRKFEVVQGVSSLTPVPPKDRDDAMTIYMLIVPPYVSDVSTVRARFIENKRYTMRDIGEIEQRVQNLEYYSTLNFLEKVAAEETFLDDSTGLPRVKTGIVVDPFSGHKVADVVNEDYSAAVDILNGEVRPGFYTRQFRFEVSNTSSGHLVNSHFVVPEYTESSFISQTVASNTVSINPFSVSNILGHTDVHNVDPEQPAVCVFPAVIDNTDGKNDSWQHDCDNHDDHKRKQKLKELNDKVTKPLKTKDSSGREVDDDVRHGHDSFKREYNWWQTKLERKLDSRTTLPVEQHEKVGSSTPAIHTTYGQNSLDTNVVNSGIGSLSGITGSGLTNILIKNIKK